MPQKLGTCFFKTIESISDRDGFQIDWSGWADNGFRINYVNGGNQEFWGRENWQRTLRNGDKVMVCVSNIVRIKPKCIEQRVWTTTDLNNGHTWNEPDDTYAMCIGDDCDCG